MPRVYCSCSIGIRNTSEQMSEKNTQAHLKSIEVYLRCVLNETERYTAKPRQPNYLFDLICTELQSNGGRAKKQNRITLISISNTIIIVIDEVVTPMPCHVRYVNEDVHLNLSRGAKLPIKFY